MSDRQETDPVPVLLHRNDRTVFKRCSGFVQDVFKAFNDGCTARVRKAKHDYPHPLPAGESDNFGKVEVICE
jgi:hypothetical protein